MPNRSNGCSEPFLPGRADVEVMSNPGAGPVENSEESHASFNMSRFLIDLGLEGCTYERNPTRDSDGRWGYIIKKGSMVCEVEMPGRPLDSVRFKEEERINAWGIPRLFVDRNSWL